MSGERGAGDEAMRQEGAACDGGAEGEVGEQRHS